MIYLLAGLKEGRRREERKNDGERKRAKKSESEKERE